jgi:16S rRNA (guanine527-N7)-methyltransferase
VIAAIGLGEGLDELFAGTAITLPREAPVKLAAWLQLLAKWNRTYNLTAIREPERMITHHALDALAVLPHLPAAPGLRVLDVGSGAGVPGIALAVARPDWTVVMLDSNAKKTAFIQQAVIELALANASIATTRVEDYAPAAPFDVVISRAFADLATFAAGSARHLAPQGVLAAMKGAFPAAELAGLPHGMRVLATHRLAVPGLDAERHLVLISR